MHDHHIGNNLLLVPHHTLVRHNQCLTKQEERSHQTRYSKTCVKRPLSKIPKIVFETNNRLMDVKSIAECSKGSILQYFRPPLSYHLSLRLLFYLFLSGRFTLYVSFCDTCMQLMSAILLESGIHQGLVQS